MLEEEQWSPIRKCIIIGSRFLSCPIAVKRTSYTTKVRLTQLWVRFEWHEFSLEWRRIRRKAFSPQDWKFILPTSVVASTKDNVLWFCGKYLHPRTHRPHDNTSSEWSRRILSLWNFSCITSSQISKLREIIHHDSSSTIKSTFNTKSSLGIHQEHHKHQGIQNLNKIEQEKEGFLQQQRPSLWSRLQLLPRRSRPNVLYKRRNAVFYRSDPTIPTKSSPYWASVV